MFLCRKGTRWGWVSAVRGMGRGTTFSGRPRGRISYCAPLGCGWLLLLVLVFGFGGCRGLWVVSSGLVCKCGPVRIFAAGRSDAGHGFEEFLSVKREGRYS